MSMQHAVDTNGQRLVNVVQVVGHWEAQHPCVVADGDIVAGQVMWSLLGC